MYTINQHQMVRWINVTNAAGDSRLIQAIKKGFSEKTIKLLIDLGADLDIQNQPGSTALMYAVGRSSKNIVQLLIDAGADPNIQSVLGWTALKHSRCVENVKTLIDAGADVNLADNRGGTPLFSALYLEVP